MRRTRKARLSLVGLEDRTIPSATVALANGNLTIRTDNVANSVTITQLATGQIQVTNNGVVKGSFDANGNIAVITGNGHDLVRLAFLATPEVFGNISIITGNGNDTVDIGGAILGNLSLQTGLGNDLVTSNTIDVNIGGSLTLADASGTNTVNLNSRNYTISGNMILNGVSNFKMGQANTLDVTGLTLLSVPPVPNNLVNVTFDGLAANFAGNVQIFGGIGNDVVSITAQLSAFGNFGVNLGSGTNSFTFTPATGGTGIGGDLSYFGGAGVDAVVLGSNTEVSGRTNINLGHGINNFVDAATSSYAGTLALTSGNGTATMIVNGDVNGNLELTHGNGNGNSTVVTGTVVGKFRFRGGNGLLNILTLAPTAARQFDADITFGAGSATFTLGPNVTLGGIVRGAPGANYTFNQGMATLAPSITFVFFP